MEELFAGPRVPDAEGAIRTAAGRHALAVECKRGSPGSIGVAHRLVFSPACGHVPEVEGTTVTLGRDQPFAIGRNSEMRGEVALTFGTATLAARRRVPEENRLPGISDG